MTKNEDVDVNKLKEIIDRLYVHELRKIVERLDYCSDCAYESNDTVIDSVVAEIQALNDKAMMGAAPQN